MSFGKRATLLLFVLLLASVALASPVELDPYGFLRFEAIWDNTELVRGDWQLWAPDANSAQADQQVLTMTARHTRFGVKFNDKEQAGKWTVKGLLEADFAGGFPNSSTAARQPLLRLRHAWVALSNDNMEVKLGQDWALLSAPFPRTANFVAGAGKGNLWMRLPQIRVTTLGKPVKASVSINRAIDGNNKYDSFTSSDLDPIGDGERSSIPFVMGRVWFGPDNATFSLFGHFGVESVADAAGALHDVNSWSANGSVELKQGAFSITGKGFYGENLNSFFGGILQGVIVQPSSVETVTSFGGWGQVGYAINEEWAATLGYGMDDPDSDYFTATSRDLNSWVFANAIYTASSKLSFMCEADYLQTEYNSGADGDNFRLMFVSMYKF